MSYLFQFGMILAISFVGELLHALLPLPVPASIYGILILFALLYFKVIRIPQIRQASMFLIEIMPILFLPAAVGLMDSWHLISSTLLQYIVITILAMVNDFLTHSAYISVFISLIAFYLGSKLFLKFHFPLFNPLLTAVLLVIGFLKVTGMDYKDYNEGASYINYLLTPSTICLAVPLYEQIKLLKKNYKAIFLGILSGVVTGLFAVYVLCLAFGFDHASYVTLLPKSITTAIGMGLSEELGGYVSITVAAIIATGILGNIIGESVCRLFHITDPIARGIALGTAAHAMGTAKAMELGPIEGAMSSLSIVVAGVFTVVFASFFAVLI